MGNDEEGCRICDRLSCKNCDLPESDELIQKAIGNLAKERSLYRCSKGYGTLKLMVTWKKEIPLDRLNVMIRCKEAKRPTSPGEDRVFLKDLIRENSKEFTRCSNM